MRSIGQLPGPLANPFIQAVGLGAALFAISLLLRVSADTWVGASSAGPEAPALLSATDGVLVLTVKALLMGVVLPALVETAILVYIVRRAPRERVGIGLWLTLLAVFALAWLLHGASPGAIGQATAFVLLGLASWAWGRRLGRLQAYGLPMLAHGVWNSFPLAIFLANTLG